MSLGLLQNPRISDQAQRQDNPLIPLNLILDQTLRLDEYPTPRSMVRTILSTPRVPRINLTANFSEWNGPIGVCRADKSAEVIKCPLQSSSGIILKSSHWDVGTPNTFVCLP
jgi:hypothetical protein